MKSRSNVVQSYRLSLHLRIARDVNNIVSSEMHTRCPGFP